MNQLKYKLIFLLLCCFNFFETKTLYKFFTTNCQQTFHFFFLSGDTPTFWIGEDNTGECEGSRLLQVSINDSTISVSKCELNEIYDWEKIGELKTVIKTLDEKPVRRDHKVWLNDEIRIEPPSYDSNLNKEYDDHVLEKGSNAFSWFDLKRNNGIKLPQIEGVKTELLFSYKRGLYINYDISDVHYFPNHYVIIFTHQPKRAVGLDTMHGFLIYRVERKL